LRSNLSGALATSSAGLSHSQVAQPSTLSDVKRTAGQGASRRTAGHGWQAGNGLRQSAAAFPYLARPRSSRASSTPCSRRILFSCA
jgi:hypothetical protein